MPRKGRISEETKAAIVRDYYEGEKEVDQIASEYGIDRRRIYEWKDKDKARGHSKRSMTKGCRLTLDEAELILLMILICDETIKGKQRYLMRKLENKMLILSDELTELKLLRTQETKTTETA